MGYEQALNNAWNEIASLSEKKKFSLRFIADEYEIDLENRKVLSLSCNVPTKEHISIILLHYLIQKLKLKTLPKPTGEWIDFRETEGGEPYYPAFKKRVIDTLLRKYGSRPEALVELTKRIPAKTVQMGDAGIIVDVFEDVPILITLWKADEEFGPEANIIFDKSILKIFCTEDIVVLADIVVNLL